MYKSRSGGKICRKALKIRKKEQCKMHMNEPQRPGCEMCRRQEYKFRPSLQPFPDDYSVAMAYVPLQTDTTVYDENKALCEGTLFPVLNLPFTRGCK